jgi:hypothetical protein
MTAADTGHGEPEPVAPVPAHEPVAARALAMDAPDPAIAAARWAFERVLVEPAPADLWELHKALLRIDGPDAARARVVARAFHGCLRELDSKSRSRRASRWGAVLGTAAVASVSLDELSDPRADPLHKLLASGLPALLEVGASAKSAEAWEVEAGLLYDDQAWFLDEELWAISASAPGGLSPDERRAQIDLVIDPILDRDRPDAERAALVVEVYRAVLAARLVPLLGDPKPPPGRAAPDEATDAPGAP